MNYSKAQRIIFDSLCKGGRCARFMLDENNLFVTPDGYRGFVIPAASVAFNAGKMKEIDPLPILEAVKPENEIKLTDDLRLDKQHKTMSRRLKGNGKNVFVNIKFLECFQNPKFYQAADMNSMIVVTEQTWRNNEEFPVGIILPVRISKIGNDYYND